VTAETSAPAAAELPRPWGRALWIAAGTLWVPTVVPLALGMLSGSSHALQGYLLFLPTIPGILAPVLFGLDDFWFVLVAVLPTLAMFGGLAVAAREMPRGLLYVVQGVVMTLIAFEAIGFAYALRA
jgi:hypothetical protein